MKKTLSESEPALAAQWVDTERSADSVTPGSGYLALWRCDKGHEWRARVYSRVKGNGCVYCSGYRVLPGFNDVASVAPHLVAEWRDEGALPSQVLAGSREQVAWECALGHGWTASIVSRTRGGHGCPVCANRKVIPSVNSLASSCPALAKEWADKDRSSSSVTAGSSYKALWRCPNGHEWRAAVSARSGARQRGCPVCSGRTTQDTDSILFTHPLLAAQWHADNESPVETISAGSNVHALWQCDRDRSHTWRAYVYNRALKGQGCPSCAAKTFTSSFEDEVFAAVDAMVSSIVERNVRSLPGVSEIDIYVPDLKVAIECNGSYWHSEAGGKGRFYHRQKRDACRAQGVTLIQVWDDDWAQRKDTVTALLRHKLSVSDRAVVHARATKPSFVSFQQASAFLNEHHIQGAVNGSWYLGLWSDSELVAVMVLKRTDSLKKVLRLERYATSAKVPGGHSKLVAFAEREIPEWEHLITFADHEVSDGGLYERTGWVRDGELAPDYKYLVRGRREHKFRYRLSAFKSNPRLEYRDGMTEAQLAALNRLYRVWDSGKTRYRYDRKRPATQF